MSFVDAAPLPMTALTAIHSLCNIARLRSGETILTRNGAGGIGQMAIQISQFLQADIYTTVGFEEKGSVLKAHTAFLKKGSSLVETTRSLKASNK